VSSDEDQPSLITPPPGLLPAEGPVPASAGAAASEPGDFITLPPGIADSATHRLATPRSVSQGARAADEEIVFFPVMQGGPAIVPISVPVAICSKEVLPARDEIIDETRVSLPRDSPPPAWGLVLPTGQSVQIATVLIIGRDPIALDAWPGATLLPVLDSAKSLSKTHALFEIDEGVLWVHDLASTNGVFVAAPGVEVVQVEPGKRHMVPDGAEVELGEFIATVLRA